MWTIKTTKTAYPFIFQRFQFCAFRAPALWAPHMSSHSELVGWCVHRIYKCPSQMLKAVIINWTAVHEMFVKTRIIFIFVSACLFYDCVYIPEQKLPCKTTYIWTLRHTGFLGWTCFHYLNIMFTAVLLMLTTQSQLLRYPRILNTCTLKFNT